MRATMWTKLLGTSALMAALVACGSVEVEVEEPTEEPTEEPEPEPEPEKAPAAAGPGMKVDELNDHRADHVGKTVTVSGFYSSTTKQGNPVEQINISVLSGPEANQENGEKTPKLLCIATPENEAMFDGLTQKSEITVSGTVDDKDFFGGAMLRDCVIAKGGDDAEAPKEGGGAKKGKKGKGKGGKRKSQ
jgi:hypothetical protein